MVKAVDLTGKTITLKANLLELPLADAFREAFASVRRQNMPPEYGIVTSGRDPMIAVRASGSCSPKFYRSNRSLNSGPVGGGTSSAAIFRPVANAWPARMARAISSMTSGSSR